MLAAMELVEGALVVLRPGGLADEEDVRRAVFENLLFLDDSLFSRPGARSMRTKPPEL